MVGVHEPDECNTFCKNSINQRMYRLVSIEVLMESNVVVARTQTGYAIASSTYIDECFVG